MVKIEKKHIKALGSLIDELEETLKNLEAIGFDEEPYYYEILKMQNELIQVKSHYE